MANRSPYFDVTTLPNILQTPFVDLGARVAKAEQALDAVGAPIGDGSTATAASETLTATGNASVLIPETVVTSAAADITITVPNGTVVGQRKTLRIGSSAGTNAVTFTITTPETATGYACSGSFISSPAVAGFEIELQWASTNKWRCLRVKRAGTQATTCGTTVLTNLNAAAMYVITCTGTNASTSTKGIPNGSAVGERMVMTVTSAGGTTGATYSITARKADGTAGTTLTLSSATATADNSAWTWDGQFWVADVLGASAVVS